MNTSIDSVNCTSDICAPLCQTNSGGAERDVCYHWGGAEIGSFPVHPDEVNLILLLTAQINITSHRSADTSENICTLV